MPLFHHVDLYFWCGPVDSLINFFPFFISIPHVWLPIFALSGFVTTSFFILNALTVLFYGLTCVIGGIFDSTSDVRFILTDDFYVWVQSVKFFS